MPGVDRSDQKNNRELGPDPDSELDIELDSDDDAGLNVERDARFAGQVDSDDDLPPPPLGLVRQNAVIGRAAIDALLRR